ncbi:MAG: phosphoribosylformylglycinamidine synthase subunit PurL [Candidatus Neomarinimicrobiota bacterium]|nr:phosphoribosylformylglycinamidine synthase subunit PurL [Candidatus Neomarinimicrobiota bacterium]
MNFNVDRDVANEHGLTNNEFEKICNILKRVPTYVELGIYSVMWSEHCSYKSSIKILKTLPRDGSNLLVAAGEENAGLVNIGDNLALAFKIESHNHPSAVEPYEGAATGVGGILRDIFTMGARPIANLNSLRFGSLKSTKNRFLLERVVEGIADYGNCVGIPTVGGELVIEDSFSGNPLVNAFTLGIVKHDETISAISKGIGNPVFIVGSKTGRDGIHGATFASVELTEESESKRSNVQVGDPFMEKLLLEASLELRGKEWLVGMQDMGAAGITCSSSEMSAKGSCGMRLNLDLVPLREKNMNPYEIMLSESQERMLIVIKKGHEVDLKNIFNKWDLDCKQIGEVTSSNNLVVEFKNKVLANIPVNTLVLGGDAPQYDLPSSEPKYFTKSNKINLDKIKEPKNCNQVLLKLLSSPNICSKNYIYNQYDSTVRTNTVIGPGHDAAVVRIKNTKKSIAITTDCNSKYVYLNPKLGGKIAVSEAARNVVCTGAKPLAITNCLNFGNPNDPEIYWQFKESVNGMGEACRIFNTPVTGGNVSFYNESSSGSVYPSPVIGMVGIIEDLNHITSMDFKKEGDFIIIIGSLNGKLGGSEYLKIIHNKIEGPIPSLDLEYESKVQRVTLEAIKSGIIKSAHDLSDGGLAVCISESLISSTKGLGAKINLTRKLRSDELLFGECQSAIVVTVEEDNLIELVKIAQSYDIPTQSIGKVTSNEKLIINNLINIDLNTIKRSYNKSLRSIMTSKSE